MQDAAWRRLSTQEFADTAMARAATDAVSPEAHADSVEAKAAPNAVFVAIRATASVAQDADSVALLSKLVATSTLRIVALMVLPRTPADTVVVKAVRDAALLESLSVFPRSLMPLADTAAEKAVRDVA